MTENFIGSKLLAAREEKGLSISDLSEITNIRKSYLLALEEENFDELPEAVYTKNFIKLSARALGIDSQELIQHYENKFQTEVIESSDNVPEYQDFSVPKKNSRISPLLIIFPLLALLLAAAAGLWFFNRDFVYKTFPQLAPKAVIQNNIDNDITTNTNTIDTSNPSNNLAASPSVDSNPDLLTTSSDSADNSLEGDSSNSSANLATVDGDSETVLNTEDSDSQVPELVAEVPETIKISIQTEPSGATVSIDNFVLAQTTPIVEAPISSGEKRNIVISLDGYTSYSSDTDLLADTNLEVVLEPIQTSEEASENSETIAVADNTTNNGIKITTTEDTWLEVYQGLARGQGKQLVYKVIKAGQEFNFDLPVYIHTGNASGVKISLNGKDLGKMGSSGEVLGRAYPKD